MDGSKNTLVVIAEDSITQAEQLKHILQKEGYEVIHGINGKEAFDQVKRYKPALVISDVVMPEMNGYEMCRLVKTAKALKNIPVILLTALNEPGDIIEGLKCGADNFITKPYNAEHLVSRIRYVLSNMPIRKEVSAETGVQINFKGVRYQIDSNRLQILDHLLSTYEISVEKNSELRRANKELTTTQRKLAQLNKNLEKEVENRTHRISRLNSLLKAIRNINQLIVRENDPREMLQKACTCLVQVRRYKHAWIMALDKGGKMVFTVQEGIGNEFRSLEKDIETGNWPSCCRKAYEQPEMVVSIAGGEKCRNCPLVKKNATLGCLTLRMEYQGTIYGIMGICMDSESSLDNEEHDLLYETAGDLGFALYDCELAAEHGQANAELKKRTQELKRSEEDLRKAQHLARLGSWVLDCRKDEIDWSDEIFSIFGLDPDTFKPDYQGFMERIYPDDREHVDRTYQDSLRTRTSFDDTFRIVRPDGEVRSVYSILEYEKDEKEETFRAIGTLQDITDRILLEQELIRAKEKAEKADELKSSFLMNMSHEIRTPMNAIVGFSNLLYRSGLEEPEREKYREMILDNSDRLIHLIDDIIDISKIETGQLAILKTDCRIGLVFDELIEAFALQIKNSDKEGIELRTGKTVQEKLSIRTDPFRLKQVLSNLLDNAIKFTDKGYVEMGYEVLSSEGRIRFYVKDTGRGITPGEQEAIFELFRKIEDRDKLFGGVGLGLTISKNLVHLLGGELSVESEPDKGSEFSFWLPLDIPDTQEVKSKVPAEGLMHNKLKDKLVLLAEDENSNAMLMEYGFKGTGARLIRASNGKEAVEMCKKNPDINLVLMDIKMPDMDGLEATRRIKQQRNDLPVIALTAYAMKQDIQKCLAAGCDEFQSKPVDFKELFDKIGNCLYAT